MSFLNEVVNAAPHISVISQIEVLGYNAPVAAQKLLADFMNDAEIAQLSEVIVQKTIEIRKLHKIKLPDAIIAATALVNGYQLISRDTNDFKNVSGLTVIDLHAV